VRLRTILILLVLIGSAVLSSKIFAQEEPSIHGTNKADQVFQERGLAIRGYDPVAYFNDKKPMKGKKEFEYSYMGAKWRFASAENEQQFSKDPAKYAPQYGGYCAYGMSHGYAASIDPKAWSLVEGKLYLNYNLDVRKEWDKDIPGHIVKANSNWPRIPKKPNE
jgi:YHS domain-containing protein